MSHCIKAICSNYPERYVTLEDPFLKGKAHDNMNQLLSIIQYDNKVDRLINPMTVKKFMGDGRMEKPVMAEKLLLRFNDIKSKNKINKLIKEENYDATDAICIAIYKE